jgi:excisionase family DNA binding protein
MTRIYFAWEVFEMADHDALFSVEEAARRLGGISKWTVHAWLAQGKIQRTKVGSRTMVRESELQKMIADGGKSPAPGKR